MPNGNWHVTYHSRGGYRVEDICEGVLLGAQSFNDMQTQLVKDDVAHIQIVRRMGKNDGQWLEGYSESRLVTVLQKGELKHYFLWLNGTKYDFSP
jgi:hypothetical protein